MTRKKFSPVLVLRAVLFLLPVSILLPHLNAFPFLPGAGFSDLLISHYPNAIYLLRSLREWHSLPFWSPSILSGYPFAANPLSGLFYLPGWLALFFPQPIGFNLVTILHLLWGGWGLFRLLREEDLGDWSALLGALLFASMPKLYSHLGAGHITLIYAVTWTPWLLWLARRSWLPGTRFLSLRRWSLTGCVLGMILLADVRWAAYAGLLWLAYSLYNAWRFRDPVASLPRLMLRGLLSAALAVLIAAPLLLPLAQFTRLATRSQLSASDNLTLSMPPGQLLGLIYPSLGSGAEWMLYPGGMAFVLFLYGLAQPQARRRAGFWLVLTVISLLLALGSYFPPAGWLASLPGFSLLRVPPRALFLSGLGFAINAAYAWQTFLDHARPAADQGQNGAKPRRSYTGLILFGVTAFVVLFASAAVAVVQQPLTRVQFGWGGLMVLLSSALIMLAQNRRALLPGLSTAVLALSLIDLLGINGLGLVYHPAQEVNGERQAITAYLLQRSGGQPFRVYSPSYSIPQQSAALTGLELADGVDPMQLANYVSFMQPATGVPDEGYSVTLPPFAGGDPTTDNASYSPDPVRLGLLNVRYVVADFPLPDKQQLASGFSFLARFGKTYIYENPRALPRAWVQPIEAGLGEKILSMPAISGRPDDLTIQAKGPGRLVLAEITYPGWQVTVDGQPAALEAAGDLLRSVQLPAGEHLIEFVFRPTPVYLGLGLASLAWLSLAALLLVGWLRIRREAQHG